MINVNVKFFALVRDITGREDKVLSLPTNAQVAAVIDALIHEYPAMKEWKNHVRVAVNWEYVPLEHQLHDEDEVAIIPPVSGG